MKKIMFFLFMVTFISTAVFAQMDQKDYTKNRSEWEKKLREELKLNSEQSVKYDAINKEYNEKIDALLKDETLNKNDLKAKIAALKKEKEAKLFEVFTPEQQAKYKEIAEKKRKEMSSRQG
jgi:N-methylhydantoinase B/oxoprolinase/acetone carboxylase alpha subunit